MFGWMVGFCRSVQASQRIVAASMLFVFPAHAQNLHVATTWDWQLTQPVNLANKVSVFDLHPDVVSAAQLERLKSGGVYTICYLSVGTLENNAPDEADFPKRVIGKVYADWPQERFLDIRRIDDLLPIMKKRFAVCKKLGFQAIEPDNMDVFDNDSGFALTEADGVRYFNVLAGAAHSMGLGFGQKNAPQLASKLVKNSDFIITEGCFRNSFCKDVLAYIRAGKPVLDAEYRDEKVDFTAACKAAKKMKISMILKDRDLTRNYRACR